MLRDCYATVRNGIGTFTVRNGKGELYGLSSYIGLRAGLNRHINDPPLSLSWSLLKDTDTGSKHSGGLVNKVWFDVQLHFGRRGNEGNRQLKPSSFTTKTDENG
ncbi:hypothetical protein F7725_007406 [Dissostichus mawsoni]|uniref:Uncharacterized protein n=1 Tax=Dissostichus mawsoni TaxID=36200 RepID=A0A7J5XWN7_DISMA|nr:hypothetical protein F7725_007406 [Dissostichus mawsoni]